jgi:hypothetical protein
LNFSGVELIAPRQGVQAKGEPDMLGTIVLVILILMLLGALPTWRYSSRWGYGPSGGLGLVLLILVVLLATGRM